MVLSRGLFATRARRMIGPLLCLFAAAIAITVGGPANLFPAVGFLLLAVALKLAAELAGRQRRLEAQVRSLRRDLRATTTAMRSSTPIEEPRKRSLKIDRRLGRMLGALRPVPRPGTGGEAPDLALRPATVTLLRRLKDERSRP